MDVHIYLLIDPRTQQPRYVGKTINPAQRLVDHCKERGTTHKNHWLAVLLREGLRPVMEVIETIKDSDDQDWQERERHWINHFFSLGLPITNLDSGGIQGKCHSAETKAKMSKSRMGFKPSDDSVRRMAQTKSERCDATERARLLSFRKGVPHSAEARARISAWGKGRPKSLEHRLKISAANKGTRPAQHTLDTARSANQQRAELRKLQLT